jgi:hypothetical protein
VVNFTHQPFYPQKRLGGSRASLSVVEKRKSLVDPGIQTLDFPTACSLAIMPTTVLGLKLLISEKC